LADVQSLADVRRIPMRKVGVKDMRFPSRVRDRIRGAQHNVARFTATINPTQAREGVQRRS